MLGHFHHTPQVGILLVTAENFQFAVTCYEDRRWCVGANVKDGGEEPSRDEYAHGATDPVIRTRPTVALAHGTHGGTCAHHGGDRRPQCEVGEGQGASAEQEVLPALLVAGDPPTEQDHAREVGEEATRKQGGVHGTRRRLFTWNPPAALLARAMAKSINST